MSVRPWLISAAITTLMVVGGCNDELPSLLSDTGSDGATDTGADASGDVDIDAPVETGACVEGAVRDADDGCNTCTCVDDAWLCTTMPCVVGSCTSHDDCVVSGCSSQICAPVPMASDCDWRDEYACYRTSITSCGCYEGMCGWEPTDALAECLDSPPCVPGDVRPADDGCNTCTCMDDGSWACTLRACLDPVCEPGTEGGDCGECWCDDDGQWLCDDVECPVCEPGEEFAADCERCVCNASGLWECDTDPACDFCEPGDTRPAGDGCNTCVCDDTERWACTEMACPSECASDDDCIETGCSGQICASESVFTTCEWLPWYACFGDPDITSCGCNEGRCGWAETEALSACLGVGAP